MIKLSVICGVFVFITGLLAVAGEVKSQPKNLQEVIEFTKVNQWPTKAANQLIFQYAYETEPHVKDIMECVEKDFGRRNFDCFKSEFYNMVKIYKVPDEESLNFRQACYSYQMSIDQTELAERCLSELSLTEQK